jgi:Zn-dependent protease with chaperone function
MEAVRFLAKVKCGQCAGKLFYETQEYFTALSSRTYEHPLDKQALGALKKVPGLPTVLKFILQEVSERQQRMLFMQNAIRVHEKHLRPLYEHLVYAANVLDLSPVPQLYVQQDPQLQAMAIGVENPFVVVTTGLLDILEEGQILGVLGHELGHIQAGHQLYRMTLYVLLQAAMGFLGGILPASAALLPIQQALLYWYRCSELTCDRAQMLVQRDFESFVRCEMKLAGGSRYTNEMLDPEQFLAQADEITHAGTLDRMVALWQEVNQSHPFPVWRAGHMHQWVAEGEYLMILSGIYERRAAAEDGNPTVFHDLEEEEAPNSAGNTVKKLLGDLRGLLSR